MHIRVSCLLCYYGMKAVEPVSWSEPVAHTHSLELGGGARAAVTLT